ncbi:MAG: hypothetical protein ABWZ79_10915 [Pedobacter agri]
MIKIFSNGFYRQNGASILFVFSTILVYCFYINTLGNVELNEVAEWNLAITIAVVSNPLMVGIFLIASIVYTFKIWQYFIKQIQLPANEFIFYSLNAASKKTQFIDWLIVYFKVMLPLWLYSFFSIIIGFSYKHYVIPIATNIFLLLINQLLAYASFGKLNSFKEERDSQRGYIFNLSFEKGINILYFLNLLDRGKIAFVFTKVISILISLWVVNIFEAETDIERPLLMVVLLIVSSHIIIIFNEYAFNERYLYFIHNLPLPLWQKWLGPLLNYLYILLPELAWLIMNFSAVYSIQFIIFGISMILFLRSLMYYTGTLIKKYLIWFFVFFNLAFLLIIYNIYYLIPPIILTVGFIMFRQNYGKNRCID